MPREEERLRKIRDIMLKHKGKANAITSRELMNKLGFTEGETYSITRSLLMKATKKYGMPIGATNSKPLGYFYIANREELDNYMGVLERRKMEIETRKKIVYENYQETYGLGLVEEDEEE